MISNTMNEGKSRALVGEVACMAIINGATNAEVLAIVRKRCPWAKTTAKCVATYRRDLRRKGLNVPTSLEARAAKRGAEREQLRDVTFAPIRVLQFSPCGPALPRT